MRDMKSKAVLSTDIEALKSYKDKVVQTDMINQTHDRLTHLEEDMGEIKQLLRQLAGQGN